MYLWLFHAIVNLINTLKIINDSLLHFFNVSIGYDYEIFDIIGIHGSKSLNFVLKRKAD